MENDTVWLNVEQMSHLFDREESNVRRHIINVFKEGELERVNNVHFLHVNGVKKPHKNMMQRYSDAAEWGKWDKKKPDKLLEARRLFFLVANL